MRNIASEPDNAGTAWDIPATQLSTLANTWRAEVVARVAADYAPFHVRVTDNLTTARQANGGNFERDYITFQACMSALNQAPSDACTDADFDTDGDVDLADLLVFQSVLTGSR